MVFYFTYNDAPSGIYFGQVSDVCEFIKSKFNINVKLVAIISIRGFLKNRRILKARYNNTIVVPMFPKIQFWRLNCFSLFLLHLFYRPKKIIARGCFASSMALRMKKWRIVKKVIFDGRGAYAAELTEYKVVENKKIISQIKQIEKKAILESDFRLSVSNALVKYWKYTYCFDYNNYAVIPCTLSRDFVFNFPSEFQLNQLKENIGANVDDILVAYSGSSAGWQSFELVDAFFNKILSLNPNIKIIFMSNELPLNSKSITNYNERFIQKWVSPNEVKNVLLACDYGILIREESMTNKVASPVKFAEYLACGLNVIISENIGDYTQFVKDNQCGYVYDQNLINFNLVPYNEKKKNNFIAMNNFTKENYMESYDKIYEQE
jgi:hypothetical protein